MIEIKHKDRWLELSGKVDAIRKEHGLKQVEGYNSMCGSWGDGAIEPFSFVSYKLDKSVKNALEELSEEYINLAYGLIDKCLEEDGHENWCEDGVSDGEFSFLFGDEGLNVVATISINEMTSDVQHSQEVDLVWFDLVELDWHGCMNVEVEFQRGSYNGTYCTDKDGSFIKNDLFLEQEINGVKVEKMLSDFGWDLMDKSGVDCCSDNGGGGVLKFNLETKKGLFEVFRNFPTQTEIWRKEFEIK